MEYFAYRIIKYSPNPENVANVPRSSDGAISAKYIPSTAVVAPDDRPTINLPTINTSTDENVRHNANKTAPIANKIAQINKAPFLIMQQKKINTYHHVVFYFFDYYLDYSKLYCFILSWNGFRYEPAQFISK